MGVYLSGDATVDDWERGCPASDDENKINDTEEADEGVRVPSFATSYLAPTFCAACWAICKCCCSVGKVLPAKALISGSLPSFD